VLANVEGTFSSISLLGHVSRFHITRLSTPLKRKSCGSGVKNRSNLLARVARVVRVARVARRRLPDYDTLL
jgi:hypothetical protein